jgi:hypothetical protein
VINLNDVASVHAEPRPPRVTCIVVPAHVARWSPSLNHLVEREQGRRDFEADRFGGILSCSPAPPHRRGIRREA